MPHAPNSFWETCQCAFVTAYEALEVRGHAVVLSAKERGTDDEKTVPLYDLSWILDEDL